MLLRPTSLAFETPFVDDTCLKSPTSFAWSSESSVPALLWRDRDPTSSPRVVARSRKSTAGANRKCCPAWRATVHLTQQWVLRLVSHLSPKDLEFGKVLPRRWKTQNEMRRVQKNRHLWPFSDATKPAGPIGTSSVLSKIVQKLHYPSSVIQLHPQAQKLPTNIGFLSTLTITRPRFLMVSSQPPLISPTKSHKVPGEIQARWTNKLKFIQESKYWDVLQNVPFNILEALRITNLWPRPLLSFNWSHETLLYSSLPKHRKERRQSAAQGSHQMDMRGPILTFSMLRTS